jgi:hypothetical protein
LKVEIVIDDGGHWRISDGDYYNRSAIKRFCDGLRKRELDQAESEREREREAGGTEKNAEAGGGDLGLRADLTSGREVT